MVDGGARPWTGRDALGTDAFPTRTTFPISVSLVGRRSAAREFAAVDMADRDMEGASAGGRYA